MSGGPRGQKKMDCESMLRYGICRAFSSNVHNVGMRSAEPDGGGGRLGI